MQIRQSEMLLKTRAAIDSIDIIFSPSGQAFFQNKTKIMRTVWLVSMKRSMTEF